MRPGRAAVNPAVWSSSRAAVDRRKGTGVPCLFLTTRCSSGADSNERCPPWAAEQEVKHRKGECHSMCRTLQHVIYKDSNRVFTS